MRHLTHCYLAPHTVQLNVPHLTPVRLVFDLPNPEGWKAEVTLAVTEMVYLSQTITHPNSN